MLELVLRVVFSLAVVLGLLWVLARASSRRFRGSSDSLVRVVVRQPLGRSAAMHVVTVGTRVLVVGVTESEVRLLTELDPEDLDSPQPLPGPPSDTGSDTRSDLDRSPDAIGGSILSGRTWRQAYAAVSGRSSAES